MHLISRSTATLFSTLLLCSLSTSYGSALNATTYYVSPDGSNNNSGLSLEDAWKTIKYSIDVIAAGDTLLLADGVYRENSVIMENKMGTPDNWTVIKSINQWGAKVEQSAQYSVGFRVKDSEYVIVDGLEVYSPEARPYQDWSSGIDILGSNHVIIQNSYAHDCGCGGFGGRESDYMTFRRNVARDNAKTNPYNCSGISIYQPIQKDDAPGTHILIEDNVVFENECRLPFEPGGFDVPTDGNGIILDDFNWTQNNTENRPPYLAETVVQNNLAFNNGGSGAKAFEVDNAIFRHNTTAYNNYVIKDFAGRLGDLAAEFVTGQVEFYNNIAVQTFDQHGSAFNYERIGGSNSRLVMHNNVIVGDVRVAGPVDSSSNVVVNADRQSFVGFRQIVPDDFEFSSVDDFRQFFALRPGSPALGAADPAFGLPTDLTGQPRPQDGALDAGAFEGAEAGSGPSTADRVRTNLIAPSFADIEIDGRLDDFYLNGRRPIDRLLEGGVTNETDLSAYWAATYDAENFYIFVDVQDADFSISSPNEQDRDGIELFIDADGSGGDSYDGENDFHYVFPLGIREFTERSFGATQGVEADTRTRLGGYAREIAIPWSTLGITPVEGTTFGFDIYVNDNDRSSGGSRQARLSWQARVNDAEANPGRFGAVTITEVAPIPTVDKLTATERITLDGIKDDAAWEDATVNVLTKYHERPITEGDADLSANWSSVWTDFALYFFVDVTDDDLRRLSNNFTLVDGFQLFLDLGYERGAENDDNDHQLVVQWGRPNQLLDGYNNLTQGARVVTRDKDDGSGYTTEIELPWFALGNPNTPAANMLFGVDLVVTDDDTGGGIRDHVLTWFADTPTPENNPSLLGRTRLGPATSASVDPQVAATLDIYPNPSSGTFIVEAPTTELLTVEVLDLAGRRVFTRTGVRSGQELVLAGLPGGSYVVSAYAKERVYRQVLQLRR